MYSCTHWLRPACNSPPSPLIWVHTRGRYWSAKVDDLSSEPPGCIQQFGHRRRGQHFRKMPLNSLAINFKIKTFGLYVFCSLYFLYTVDSSCVGFYVVDKHDRSGQYCGNIRLTFRDFWQARKTIKV